MRWRYVLTRPEKMMISAATRCAWLLTGAAKKKSADIDDELDWMS